MLTACQRAIVEDCHKLRPRWENRNISSEVLKGLAIHGIPTCRPKGAVLFIEGEPSRGVFILRSGRVKLFTASADGKTFILRFADPGEILGLAGALSGRRYEASAEAIQPTQIIFVEREHFVHFMRRNNELSVEVAMHLGESYCSAISRVRTLGLSRSAAQKLAVFLLNWCENNLSFHGELGTKFTLTADRIYVIYITAQKLSRL